MHRMYVSWGCRTSDIASVGFVYACNYPKTRPREDQSQCQLGRLGVRQATASTWDTHTRATPHRVPLVRPSPHTRKPCRVSPRGRLQPPTTHTFHLVDGHGLQPQTRFAPGRAGGPGGAGVCCPGPVTTTAACAMIAKIRSRLATLDTRSVAPRASCRVLTPPQRRTQPFRDRGV